GDGLKIEVTGGINVIASGGGVELEGFWSGMRETALKLKAIGNRRCAVDVTEAVNCGATE
ncbi:hypothetical protein A2U01_0100821, partial [Trifolium medium]|nr:hypothetical protein [Trifolium medium]